MTVERAEEIDELHEAKPKIVIGNMSLSQWSIVNYLQIFRPDNSLDREVLGAKCKNCNGDRHHNKLGVPEIMLHCSSCEASNHPTCLGLCLVKKPTLLKTTIWM